MYAHDLLFKTKKNNNNNDNTMPSSRYMVYHVRRRVGVEARNFLGPAMTTRNRTG